MDKNREVLKHCPHFYTIVNFEYYKDDVVSERLINIYEKFIFNADVSKIENVNKIEKLDKVLYQYTNDYAFRSQMKADISSVRVKKSENVLESIVNAIIKLFENYENLRLRKLQVTRWI